jgi:hypothetical protein
MLHDIQKFLELNGQLSLRELALHFQMEPDAIEPMLDLLIRKARIRRIDFSCSSGRSCSSCSCVSRSDVLLYEAL